MISNVGGATKGGVATVEAAVEQFEGEVHAETGEHGIVARAFVAQEGVLAVDLDPLEIDSGFFQTGVDPDPAFERHMGILPTPDVEEFSMDFARAFEGAATAIANTSHQPEKFIAILRNLSPDSDPSRYPIATTHVA